MRRGRVRLDRELLERILDAVPDPLFVKDREHRWVVVNRAFTALLGRSAEELLGKSDHDVFSQEQSAARWAHDDEVFRSGEVSVRDFEFTDATGVAHVTQTKKAALLALDGTQLLVGVVRDITDVRRAHVQTESRYRSLAENLNVLVYRADPVTFQTTYVNRVVEDLYGCRAEDWLADPTLWERTLHPDDRKKVLAEFTRMLAARGEGRIEYRIVRRDGTVRWVVDSFAYEHDSSGTPVALAGIMADVTERRSLYERLAESARAKSAFLAAMSHELKTPLNAILGFAELLRDETIHTSTARGHAEEIRAAGRRLLALLTDVLEFVRLEEGAAVLRHENVDMALLLSGAAAAQKAEAERRGIALKLDVAGAGGAIVDAGRVKQLAAQLLSNALKFTPQGGRVGLRAARSADARSLEIAVEDSGIGIAPEDVADIFEPFVQLDSALSRKYGGTGLGLALARRIAELHGGTIEVQSEQGKGSTFTVRLPLEEPRK